MGDPVKPVAADDRTASRVAICSAYANDSGEIDKCFKSPDAFQESPAEKSGSSSTFFKLDQCVRLSKPVPWDSAFFGYQCRVSNCKEVGGAVACEPFEGVKAEVVMANRMYEGRRPAQWVELKAGESGTLRLGRFAESWYYEFLAKTYLGVSNMSDIPWYDHATLGAVPCRILWGDQAIVRE